jgi:multidrug efflux system outer membrane protein
MKSSAIALATRASAATLLAGLLSACSFIPPHQTPTTPVAADWPAAASSSSTTTTGQAAADLAWADFLPDARLRALVDMALRNNRDLRIAALNVEQLRALYGVQRADRLPTVGVGASANSAPNSSGSNTTTYSVGFQLSSLRAGLLRPREEPV